MKTKFRSMNEQIRDHVYVKSGIPYDTVCIKHATYKETFERALGFAQLFGKYPAIFVTGEYVTPSGIKQAAWKAKLLLGQRVAPFMLIEQKRGEEIEGTLARPFVTPWIWETDETPPDTMDVWGELELTFDYDGEPATEERAR